MVYRKRWYLQAGATLPFIGKTSFAAGKRPYRKKTYRKKTTRSYIATVAKSISPANHKIFNNTSSALTHNTIASINVASNIPQGTSENARHGDQIQLEAIKYRIQLDKNPSTNANTRKVYRVMFVKLDSLSGSGVDTWTATVGSTDLFHTTAVPVHGLVNSKNVTVLLDRMVVMQPQLGTATHDTRFLSGIIPLKCKHVYKSGTNDGKWCNYYFVVIGFEPGGTTGVTNIGNVLLSADLIFKNI